MSYSGICHKLKDGLRISQILLVVLIPFDISAQVSDNFSEGIGIGPNKSWAIGVLSSFQIQDRRLFDFPQKKVLIENEDDPLDYQFDVTIIRTFNHKSRFQLAAGGGYSLRIEKFSRPFDHPCFTGKNTEDLRYIGTYYTHGFVISAYPAYSFPMGMNHKLAVVCPISVRCSLLKSILDARGNNPGPVFDFQFDNIELNVGLQYELKRFSLALNGRVLNLQYKDPVIFYSTLFHEDDPEFLQTKLEFKNYFKLGLGISYRLTSTEK